MDVAAPSGVERMTVVGAGDFVAASGRDCATTEGELVLRCCGAAGGSEVRWAWGEGFRTVGGFAVEGVLGSVRVLSEGVEGALGSVRVLSEGEVVLAGWPGAGGVVPSKSPACIGQAATSSTGRTSDSVAFPGRRTRNSKVVKSPELPASTWCLVVNPATRIRPGDGVLAWKKSNLLDMSPAEWVPVYCSTCGS
jgi:hypothetical protein